MNAQHWWRRQPDQPAGPEAAAGQIRLPELPTSEAEAERRFAATRHTDPFPDIAPSLLNTADLVDYIAATGMVYPFNPDPANPSIALKPASCGIQLAGTVLWWEPEEPGSPELVQCVRELAHGEKLLLKRNSIVFVTLEPTLRMPDYIAARFNLTIRDIYRGILVGTGPLVDPGFSGRLSLPLHNLTLNDYELTGGEPIVWMEFTKLSANTRWTGGAGHVRCGEYVPFPERKRGRGTVQDYVKYASAQPITSSIPRLVEDAQRAAGAAARDARAIARRQLGFSMIAAVAVVVGLAAVVFGGFQLVDGVDGRQRDLARQVDALQRQISVLRPGATAILANPRPALPRRPSATGG